MGKRNFNHAFIFTILLFVAVFISLNLISHYHLLNCETLDFSRHLTQPYSSHVEDDISYFEPVTNKYKMEVLANFHPVLILDFESSYYSEIWRPPRKSC